MNNIFKQISYSPEMILAILANRKNQTRRLRGLKWANLYGEFSKAEIVHDAEILDLEGDLVKLPGICASFDDGEWVIQSPYQVGDILWVRESFRYCQPYGPESLRYQYQDFTYSDIEILDHYNINDYDRWRPSIHMPKTACRIWQKVKSVRIERLGDISKKDAIAEGIERLHRVHWWKNYLLSPLPGTSCPVNSFQTLWQSIHGQPSPVYKKENGKQILSHYEVYPFSDMLANQFRNEFGLPKFRGKQLVICPNPWVWVVEFENIFEAPEGFL